LSGSSSADESAAGSVLSGSELMAAVGGSLIAIAWLCF
jgi:hypothetical protein